MSQWMNRDSAALEWLTLAGLWVVCLLACASLCRAETPTTAPAKDVKTVDVPKGEIPNSLVGKWSYGSVSPTTYWDSDTGKFLGNARGSAGIYEFKEDGTYKEYVYLEMRTYGLVTTVWTVHGGTAVFKDGKFTLHPTSGHYKSDSGSRHIDRDMTEKELKDHVKTYDWKSETDSQGRETFVIPFDDGSKFEYRRAEK